ncbi:MAG: ABC transporter permease [Dehalococcoidales bacterium]|nr:ABC transporter permease [Dehalococcoidales bacterium]
MNTTIQTTNIMEVPNRVSPLRRFFRVFLGRKVVVFGTLVILGFAVCAAFSEWIAPYPPNYQDFNAILLQPAPEHLLGTDSLGRDTLSRIIFGSRTAIMVGVVALSIAAGIGMTLGITAGYFGGMTYAVIMRIIDAFMAFPALLIALTVAALLGGGILNVMIALGIGMMPGFARVMCGQALSIRENDYVLAGRSLGGSNIHIMFRHVLPNCFPPMIVMMTMMIGTTILAEAGLSFLGIGVDLGVATWGGMVNEGYPYLLQNPILSFAPGFSIMVVVFAFNMVGDGIRDAIDPRLRGTF